MKRFWKDYLFVGVQFILFGLYFFDFLPKFQIPEILSYLGLTISLLGIAISLMAVFNLDKNLTVYPTPKTNSELTSSGLYKFSRHPIYTGIIVFAFGFAFFRMSYFKLLIALFLLVWFFLKSRYEEKRLQEKYPDYEQYKEKTGRFFPKIKF